MRTRYQYPANTPYILHDMHIHHMEQNHDTLKLYFADGYRTYKAPFAQVAGNIMIEGVDCNDCNIYFLSQHGKYGHFQGQKMTMLSFMQTYPTYTFEIINELYGYQQIHYLGYLSLPNQKHLIECCMMIYHTGDIVYETEK